MKSKTRKISYGVLLFMNVFSAGCTSYQMGVGMADGMRSIYVEPVKNSSLCPQASGTLTAQLAKAIQRTTPLKLAEKNEADCHLQVEIVDYSQPHSAYDPGDTSIVLSLNLRIVVECTLVNQKGNFLLECQRIEACMDLEKCNHFHSLRDQAIPQLMGRLARKICAFLVNIW
ncbi:MAG: LPS assembly lipoprotein LptE [Puniceicoccales bacterium]|jgi:hypothetical protein|nr:LPS assembly lipoprotein LptE [Puniceicoccales bacterium]